MKNIVNETKFGTNMREIKFRAWHKNANYMCMNATTDLLNRDYLIFMQYTGLKDINGKEIYEGDILRCKCNESKYKINVIEWWQSYCNLGYRLKDSKGHTLMIKPTHLKTMEVEIIGNIYENPELLQVCNN